MANISDIKKIINSPNTLKLVASVGIDGVPYTAVKQTLYVDTNGNLKYVELFESSKSYKNITASVWYDKKVSVAVIGENKESYNITGRVDRINIAGSEFEMTYTEVLEQKGFDIAAIITIIPENVEEQSAKKKFKEQEAARPFYRHLDRLSK